MTQSALCGYIHSVETFGTVDGPGIRYIIFMSGCALRCQYCHNPDTWKMKDGKIQYADDLVKDILRYKSYMKSTGGGVTISGGEPLLQAEFVKELTDKLHDHQINVALDICGFPAIEEVHPAIDAADLILLDIKAIIPETFELVTAQELQPTLNTAAYLQKINKRTWIRFVLVPGLTDSPENVHGLAKYISGMPNVELVEVLPFHKMGEHKWEVMGLNYQLKNTPVPSEAQIAATKAIFSSYGLKVQ